MNRKTTTYVRDFIRAMPKVELHLHLEGAFTLGTLLQLVRKYEPSSALRTEEDLKSRFVYRDFSQFIDTWVWKNRFYRRGSDFELSAYETLLHLRAQEIVYIEAFFSPWDFLSNGISMEEITESTIAGCERASRECGIQWKLIADINREHGPEAARTWSGWPPWPRATSPSRISSGATDRRTIGAASGS